MAVGARTNEGGSKARKRSRGDPRRRAITNEYDSIASPTTEDAVRTKSVGVSEFASERGYMAHVDNGATCPTDRRLLGGSTCFYLRAYCSKADAYERQAPIKTGFSG